MPFSSIDKINELSNGQYINEKELLNPLKIYMIRVVKLRKN